MNLHRIYTKREIRRILLQVWDAIGIKDEPNAQDEYYTYEDGIFELLGSGASDDEIARHLQNIVTETMGMHGATAEAMRDTVLALRAIKLP